MHRGWAVWGALRRGQGLVGTGRGGGLTGERGGRGGGGGVETGQGLDCYEGPGNARKPSLLLINMVARLPICLFDECSIHTILRNKNAARQNHFRQTVSCSVL